MSDAVRNAKIPAEGLSIGEAAAAMGLSIDTLRYYEREGLTADPVDRAASGQRRYFARDLDWLDGIVMLRGTGMPIRNLREFTVLCRTAGTEAERLAIFTAHREQVLAELSRTQRHLAAIDSKIAYYTQLTHDAEFSGSAELSCTASSTTEPAELTRATASADTE
jgi:DNA-binding transcriptional MerR regulator